jgi:hypothetical protein
VVMGVFEDMTKSWVRACCPAEMAQRPDFVFCFFGCEDARAGGEEVASGAVFALSSAGESEVRIP